MIDMSYWMLKSCPKCHGDLYVESNAQKPLAYCLQCGARAYVAMKENRALTEKHTERELVAAK